MTTLLSLVLAIGLAPLAIGLARLAPSPPGYRPWPPAGSVLLCALAFNLTFFWQELWLVLPKALTPGLHPVLYHNDHDWTGAAPTVELLQGTGALSTLASGLAFAGVLIATPRTAPSWRIFFFWMAFQGLYQSLSQVAIGALLPGNDVGRALAYLRLAPAVRGAVLLAAVTAMALAGAWLARTDPEAGTGRAFAYSRLLLAAAVVVLVVPFRLPRNLIEVALVPGVVNLIGIAWVTLGSTISPQAADPSPTRTPAIMVPALALGATLVLFQVVLRPGIAF